MELKKLKEAKKLTKVATKYPTITLNGVPEFNPLSNNDYVIEEKTNWNAVMMAGIVTFLSAVENTVVGMSEWPYMHTIDPEATSQFFGLVSSVSKFGHAIFAVIFAFWAYKAQSIKMPLIVGRVIAFFACCLYLCIELLPEGRRYLMLLCYFLFGIASSSSTVLRAYIVAVSTAHDRAKAFSAFIVANMLSIVVGPVCQLAFAAIRYPGFEFINGYLKFHIYSAPIWIATLTNFISVTIIYYGLMDVKSTKKTEDLDNMFNLENIKYRLKNIMTMNIKWPLVIVCWLEKMIVSLSIVTMHSVVSPLLMISFGWDGQKTVNVLSICMGLVGILAISIAAAFIFFRIGNIISPRMSFLFSVALSVGMYVFSYPYHIISHKMIAYNDTLGIGCDPRQYTWCETAYATSPVIFLSVICALMGIGAPLSAISLDTIYSKVLGKIDQNVMQGAFVFVDDVILIFGPLYAASMFTYNGPATLWLVNGLVTACGLLFWLTFFRQLKQFK